MPFTRTNSVRYVHPDGDDRNDGHTWLSAKKSILSAYDALPGEGGTIYFAPNSLITPVGEPLQGLWIFGPTEERRPGPGWRLQKSLVLSGVGGYTRGSVPPGNPAASLLGYNPALPLIWIVGTEFPMHFENMIVGDMRTGIRLGDRTHANQGVSNVSFYNVHILLSRSEESGPCVQIGDNCFWIWFDHCAFGGAPGANWNSDQRAAILVDGGGLHIQDCIFSDGGFRYYVKPEAPHGWSFTIRKSTFEINLDELTYTRHPIHVLNATLYGLGYIENVDFADPPFGTEPKIKIEGGLPEGIVIINANPGFVEGPATVLSRYPGSYQLHTSTPSAQNQIGFWQGRISAQHDSARRSFAPVAVRSANLAIQNAARWAGLTFPFHSHNVAISEGTESAPDGTMQAGRIKCVAPPGAGDREGWLTLGSQEGPLSVAEYVVAGVWVREAARPPIDPDNNANALQVALKDTRARFDGGQSDFSVAPPILGDGEWEWVTGYARISTLDPDPLSRIEFLLKCHDGGRVRDFYAPIFLRIPADQISANEAAELVQHLSTWPPGTPAGSVTTLPGQKLIARSGLGIGNAEPVESDSERDLFVGSNIHMRMPIFDSHGDLLGYIPVYRDH